MQFFKKFSISAYFPVNYQSHVQLSFKRFISRKWIDIEVILCSVTESSVWQHQSFVITLLSDFSLIFQLLWFLSRFLNNFFNQLRFIVWCGDCVTLKWWMVVIWTLLLQLLCNPIWSDDFFWRSLKILNFANTLKNENF